ncbi:GNAT family N-acetyltransferase [Nesterenkonia sp. NBAIMH1]|uniref:GNAT family N-acetyltransferase n=1 Tax=Nesterenkonia sp. NBAIMH1 TaxID=2600320 RepID=UPI0011B7A41F|nr:GNAT family N-acetyltransferase [Nesterenkonia sp. NBAIMH1]
MNTDYLIREPQPEDAEALGRMHTQAWRESYAHFLPERLYDADAEAERITMWQQSLSRPFTGTRRIALHHNHVVGFADYGPAKDDDAPRSHQLYGLYILAAHHGTGLAPQLIDHVLGPEPSYLEVFKDNPRAIRFYTRYGFVPHDELPMSRWDTDPTIAHISALRLTRG